MRTLPGDMHAGPAIPARRSKLTLLTARGAHVLDIEIARSLPEQRLGLMFATSVPDNAGMLFVYSSAREVAMWMKNTLVPLDMVFIRAGGTVHRIERRTVALSEASIPSRGAVVAVLELAGGSADRLGLRPGDRVLHPAFAASG